MKHQTGSSSRSATRRRSAASVALVSLALLAAGGLLLGQAADALSVEVPSSEVAGRVILSADPSPSDLLELAPGDPAHWQVSVRMKDATRATVAVELRRSGAVTAVPPGLRVTVASCSEAWRPGSGEPACGSGEIRVPAAPPPEKDASAGPFFDIAAEPSGAPAHLLVTLSTDQAVGRRAAEALADLGDDLSLGLRTVAVDGIPVARAGGHAPPGTGLLPLVAAIAIAAGVVGLGSALRLARGGSGRGS